jgi:uncharacterized delta-60 repeat protein
MPLNEAGTLDQDFGENGIVSITVPGYHLPTVAAVLSTGIGPDRKIYVTGWCESTREDVYLYFLSRLNSDGSADTSFGQEGQIIGRFPEKDHSRFLSLALQDDGKIVLFGNTFPNELLQQPGFARYNYDGSLDETFGDKGYCVLDLQLSPPAKRPSSEENAMPDTGLTVVNEYHVEPSHVKILPDGKILAFDYVDFRGDQGVGVIIRLDKNGALDTDFNQIGFIQVMHPDYIWGKTQLRNLLVQSDGKYLGCGALWSPVKLVLAMFVRYESTGEIDHTFGDNGFVTFDIGDDGIGLENIRFIECMTEQPNGRILGAGYTNSDRGLMTSIEPDGSPNIQFNAGKPLYTMLEADLHTRWTDVAIQKNGRILVVGGAYEERSPENLYDIVVARYINAQLDPSFNGGKGWVRLRFENGVQHATGVVLQEDGKILVSAQTPNNKGTLLRFHA